MCTIDLLREEVFWEPIICGGFRSSAPFGGSGFSCPQMLKLGLLPPTQKRLAGTCFYTLADEPDPDTKSPGDPAYQNGVCFQGNLKTREDRPSKSFLSGQNI